MITINKQITLITTPFHTACIFRLTFVGEPNDDERLKTEKEVDDKQTFQQIHYKQRYFSHFKVRTKVLTSKFRNKQSCAIFAFT